MDALVVELGGNTAKRILPPPPFGFTSYTVEDITDVKRLAYGEHPITQRRPRGTTASQKAGLRYQRRICEVLPRQWRDARIKASLHVGPWLRFDTVWGRKHCQPDALIETEDAIYIIEIKLSSTLDAWWQLVHLYGPVVERLYGRKPRLINVVKLFNPDIGFPDDWPLVFDPSDVFNHERCILPWRV